MTARKLSVGALLSAVPLSVAGDYCCWWPQNLPSAECDSRCVNKDHDASRSTCVIPATWCNSSTPLPPPRPQPSPSPTSSDEAFDDNTSRLPFAPSATATPWPSGSGSHVTVSVDVSTTVGTFTKYHMGINVPDYTNRELLRAHGADLIEQAGFKFIRFPGGSPADAYLWDNSYEKYPFFKQYRGDYDNGVHTDDIIELCNKTGAEPLIQINYAMFVLYGQEAGTSLAVRWYEYFKSRGIHAKYWELGNENSGGWELPQSSKDCKGFDGPPSMCQSTNGEQYGKDLAYLITAMKSIDPEVKVGAWLETNEQEDGAGQRKAKWDSLLMPQLKSAMGQTGAADWLNIHSYFWQPMDWGKGQYTPYAPAELYNHDQDIVRETTQAFDSILSKYFPEGSQLPVAITEWNIDQAFPHADPQVDEHISALVTASIVGQAITKAGVRALNYFSFMDGWKTNQCASGPCPAPADLGMITSGQPGVADGIPRPAWFSFAIWSRSMGNRMVRCQSSATSTVETYASQFASGEVGMIVINKGSEDVSLTVTGVGDHADARGYILTAADPSANPLDYSAGSSLNGHGPSTGNIGGPFPIDGFQPYAMKASGAAAQLFIPKVSLVGVIFYPAEASIIV